MATENDYKQAVHYLTKLLNGGLFILVQYGMGSEEAMEMVLNAICTYTKGITETFLKGVPMA